MKENSGNTKVKDNICVNVFTLGGKTEYIKFEPGITISDILEKIETKIRVSKVRVIVEGSDVRLTTPVNSGDMILVMPVAFHDGRPTSLSVEQLSAS